MHTFFINTTGKNLDMYNTLLEIQIENRELIVIDCPISEWGGESAAERSCIKRIGELIDSRNDIYNDFNIVMYIDMVALAAKADFSSKNESEKRARLQVMRNYVLHYIHERIYRGLSNVGRQPQEILVVFEENADILATVTNDCYVSAELELLGLPDEDSAKAICDKGYEDSAEQIVKAMRATFLCELRDTYGKNILSWANDVASVGYTMATEQLHIVLDNSRLTDLGVIKSVSFEAESNAVRENRASRTKHYLKLCIFLLDCVYSGTIYEKDEKGDKSDSVKTIKSIQWDEFGDAFCEKKDVYKQKYKELEDFQKNYNDARIAPKLRAFNNERFGMDKYGKPATISTIVDDVEKTNDGVSGGKGDISIVRPQKRVEDKKAERTSIIEGYKPFDYSGTEYKSKVNEHSTTKTFIDEALGLRKHHMDFLSDLKLRIDSLLANFAGRSRQGVPALLAKRRISVADEDFEKRPAEYNYAKSSNDFEVEKPIEAVKGIAEKAYETAKREYLRFSAGRSIAITDIQDQCDWFISRVNQITESLKKIKIVAIGIFFALLIVYVPYFVIQWDNIFESMSTISIALASLGAPLLLLYAVFSIISARQRRRYYKAWEDFVKKSDEIIANNANAVRQYEQLLSVFTPTLRWVYEYKLDVEFFDECFELARAKIEHHSQKLSDRITTIGNVLEDLEYNEKTRVEKEHFGVSADVDLNLPFCVYKKNSVYYSLIEEGMLNKLLGKETE